MKIKTLVFICLIISTVYLISCSNNEFIDYTRVYIDGKCECDEEVTLKFGSYVFGEENYGLYPCVTVENDNNFSFVFSGISSYIGFGKYMVDKGYLYLNADDNCWCFKIETNKIVYDLSKSNGYLWFSNIKDGSELLYQE